jgi:hypothetical protein
MFNSDTELLFPTRVIPALRNLRGDEWKALIDKLSSEDANEIDLVAFTFMIARLASCNACNADSFRAMRGCTQCSRLIIKRYKNSDHDLLELYVNARKDVEDYLTKISYE